MNTKRSSSATRDIILSAAANVVLSRGASQMTLEAVAKEAGVKRVAVVHWPTEYEKNRDDFKALILKHYDCELYVPNDFDTIEV